MFRKTAYAVTPALLAAAIAALALTGCAAGQSQAASNAPAQARITGICVWGPDDSSATGSGYQVKNGTITATAQDTGYELRIVLSSPNRAVYVASVTVTTDEPDSPDANHTFLVDKSITAAPTEIRIANQTPETTCAVTAVTTEHTRS